MNNGHYIFLKTRIKCKVHVLEFDIFTGYLIYKVTLQSSLLPYKISNVLQRNIELRFSVLLRSE